MQETAMGKQTGGGRNSGEDSWHTMEYEWVTSLFCPNKACYSSPHLSWIFIHQDLGGTTGTPRHHTWVTARVLPIVQTLELTLKQ